MHRTPGGVPANPDPPHLQPIGTPVEVNGEPGVIIGYSEITGCPIINLAPQAIESDEDGFELGTPDAEKARDLRIEAQQLADRARRVPAGPEREWALSRAKYVLRRSHVLTAASRQRPQCTGRHEARPAARRAGSSSSSSGADPGEGADPEPPDEGLCTCGCRPSKPIRRCACGCRREITHKRADAKTFGASCRKRLARDTARERFEPDSAQRCECQSGWFYRDAEGDAVCGLCGCWLAKVTHAPGSHELIDALMRANGVYVRPRPLSKPWNDTQAAYRRREAVA